MWMTPPPSPHPHTHNFVTGWCGRSQQLLPLLVDFTAWCLGGCGVPLLGIKKFDFSSWNSIFARWRLQQFKDTQKHILHSIPQSTVPAPPYYNLQYNLILPFHYWRATLPVPCTNLPFPLSHSCVTTLI